MLHLPEDFLGETPAGLNGRDPRYLVSLLALAAWKF